MPPKAQKHGPLIKQLNQALGWELRAQAMYAHYAAYVKGLESTLAGHFEGRPRSPSATRRRCATSSRCWAARPSRCATRRRSSTPRTRASCSEALKTEETAAAAYRKIVPLVKELVFFHSLSHIMMDEMKAVEMENLLGR